MAQSSITAEKQPGSLHVEDLEKFLDQDVLWGHHASESRVIRKSRSLYKRLCKNLGSFLV
jgi:hypothetical protein